jgi:hypothetical protein
MRAEMRFTIDNATPLENVRWREAHVAGNRLRI